MAPKPRNLESSKFSIYPNHIFLSQLLKKYGHWPSVSDGACQLSLPEHEILTKSMTGLIQNFNDQDDKEAFQVELC